MTRPQTPHAPSDAPQTGVTVKTRLKTQRPAMYKVLLLNDDFTPMEFVVDILMGIFGKSEPEATDVMLHVHRKGVGLCGVFSFEVAETKMTQVLQAAKVAQHPLKCVMEKE